MSIVMHTKWGDLPYLAHYVYIMVPNTLYCQRRHTN